MTGLLLLIVFGFGALAWWHLLQGRERAWRAASAVCRQHGLELMDDTVIFDSVRWHERGESRSYSLCYHFEFVREGIRRKGGSVLIRSGQPAKVIIAGREGLLIEEF